MNINLKEYKEGQRHQPFLLRNSIVLVSAKKTGRTEMHLEAGCNSNSSLFIVQTGKLDRRGVDQIRVTQNNRLSTPTGRQKSYNKSSEAEAGRKPRKSCCKATVAQQITWQRQEVTGPEHQKSNGVMSCRGRSGWMDGWMENSQVAEGGKAGQMRGGKQLFPGGAKK